MSEPRAILAACPDPEALSAYVDGKVDPQTRRAIEEHLNSCEACYDLVVETVRTLDDMSAAEPRPVPARASRRSIYSGIGLLAAAAALVLAVRPGGWLREPDAPADRAVAALVAAVGAERIVEPRLTGGFQFGPLRTQLRGPSGANDLALMAAAGEAGNAAAVAPGPDTLHASAIGQLLIGEYDTAIRTLEDACRRAPAKAACEADLGAAYLARATVAKSSGDLDQAATHTRRAIELQPGLREATFNEALILERKDLRQDAAAAWSRYIAIDPDSPWAAEARRHRARLGT